MPTAYQMKVVRPAHAAAAVKSLSSVRGRRGTAPERRVLLCRPAYGRPGGVAESAICRRGRGRKVRTVAMQSQVSVGPYKFLRANGGYSLAGNGIARGRTGVPSRRWRGRQG